MAENDNRRIARLVVPITVAEEEKLEVRAQSEHRSKSALIRMALEKAYPDVFAPQGKS